MRTRRAERPQTVCDVAAERAVLGACLLLSAQAILEAAEILTPVDFSDVHNAQVFEAILSCEMEGSSVDPVTVHAKLVTLGYGEGMGVEDLDALAEEVPNSSAVRDYATTVAELARKRRLVSAGHELTEAAGDPTRSAHDVLVATEERLLLAGGEEQGGRCGPAPVAEIVPDVAARIEGARERGGSLPGLTTGLMALDELARGMEPGDLVVIAGRTGMGKTSAVARVATANATNGVPVLLFSLEMPAQQIVQRFVSAQAHLTRDALEDGRLTGDEQARVQEALAQVGSWPLFIDDRAGLSLMELRLAARGVQQRHGLGLVVVDYLQLVSVPAERERSREREVSAAAQGLKELAKDLGCPVVAGAQLNREGERGRDKRPVLANLRESGNIEQAADLVVGLYRDDYYDSESTDAGTAEMIVLKHRRGKTGTARVAWLGAFTAFCDLPGLGTIRSTDAVERSAPPDPLGTTDGSCPICHAPPPRQGFYGIAACEHQKESSPSVLSEEF